MQGKWEEMFGVKEEQPVQEVKVKQPRKERIVKEKATGTEKIKKKAVVKKKENVTATSTKSRVRKAPKK